MPELPSDFPPDAAVREIRLPPHAADAEQAVLGSLLVAEDALQAWDEISDLRLREEDFYRREHRDIFKVFCVLAEEREPFDAVTVATRLGREQQLDAVGGVDYLYRLADSTPSAVNIAAYARIVSERSLQRRLIAAARTIAEQSYSPKGRSGQELLDEAERTILRVGDERRGPGGPEQAAAVVDRTLARIEELHQHGREFTGLPTGFPELDRRTSGLQPADLIIIAARPSAGKTALAMNIAQHAALHQEKPVVVFSMEMSAEAIMQRMLSAHSHIPHMRLRNGRLQDDDLDRLAESAGALKKIRLFIDPGSELTPPQLRSRVRRLSRSAGEPALIVVDYLQLMQGAAQRQENRNQEVAGITRSLKAMAKEFNCPMLVLSQLSRHPEHRGDKRPGLADLRDSGAIEQDADLVLFLHARADSQSHGAPAPDASAEGEVRTVELIIGKQRNGPIGHWNLQFQSRHIRFQEPAPEDRYENTPYQPAP